MLQIFWRVMLSVKNSGNAQVLHGLGSAFLLLAFPQEACACREITTTTEAFLPPHVPLLARFYLRSAER